DANFKRLCKSDDTRHVERARAQSALVAAAIHLGCKLHARRFLANVKCAYAFRSINFMSGNGGKIDIHLLNIEGNLSNGLRGIRMEDHALFVAELADNF